MSLLIGLIRHGRPIFPDERPYMLGKTDWPLSERGQWEVCRLAAFLGTLPKPQKIFSSPLSRARQTAEILFPQEEILLEPSLMEVGLGIWDGLSVEEVRRRCASLFDLRGRDLFHFRPEGGESFEDLSKRILPFFEKLVSEETGFCVVVGHAGVFRVFLSHFFEIPFERTFSMRLDYSSLSLVKIANGKVELTALNCFPSPEVIGI